MNKKTESDKTELFKMCSQFSIKNDNFYLIIEKSLEIIEDFQTDLSQTFDVNIETVNRWAKRSAKPLPRFQKLVIKLILQKLRQ